MKITHINGYGLGDTGAIALTWYRIYDYMLDNTTKVSLRVYMENGGVQDEWKVGDRVYLVNGKFIDLAGLESLRASAKESGFYTLLAGWIAIVVILACVLARFFVWLHEAFRIESFIEQPVEQGTRGVTNGG